ncbi:hypothetical protein LEM8419_00797 [Neolewinella maritima]|uniref:Endonuclease/exonuclease/phosphatase domain-containing protein n=1 Tax=Neolewinella maritima TaxID=1383882 RepID=A0ABM9AYI2_9BACT|nr:endonuclease/exonuclease/phosphatase family protein [Neolewinella maritima]CAH0999497.1 hypothetical protein LEM8419_00797 [Neolewinella maritima]
MTLTLWNIDHPTYLSKRLNTISDYLLAQSDDLLILTEANEGLQLPGYRGYFSAPSPYLRKGRTLRPPNAYRQVAIYSRTALTQLPVRESINGVLCRLPLNDLIYIYGNVITIKDRWAPWSTMRYSDRLTEQLQAIRSLHGTSFIVCGDFNFRAGSSYNKSGYTALQDLVHTLGLRWPTADETRTVQQIVHSPDLLVTYRVGEAGGLSDHPPLHLSLRTGGPSPHVNI